MSASDCPECGHAMIVIFDNGHAYRWCPVCGHKEMVY